MLQNHKIPYHMARSIKDLIDDNADWYSVIKHISKYLPNIKNTPRICDISFWNVVQNDGQTEIYCQEDSGCEHLFIGTLSVTLPPKKFYLCLNELGGYTLMLPEDY